MLFRCIYHNKNLYWKIVKHETIEEYIDGINYLKANAWNIQAIVCDGKKGLFYAFGNIPVQMCHFHQVAIIRRYITKNPKLQASVELQDITYKLKSTSKECFVKELNEWYIKWKTFLNQKTINEINNKNYYTHKNLRSAYRSLKINLPFLFTYKDYPHLCIPNTTASIEDTFSNLKTKINIHQGLKRHRKIKLINEILK